jgi:hypothetical protein
LHLEKTSSALQAFAVSENLEFVQKSWLQNFVLARTRQLAGALALFVCVTGFRNSSAMFDQLQINYVDINLST